MSRHGTYDLKYGFIPDADCPQSKPYTNADHIRAMTDDELADFLDKTDPVYWDRDIWLKWLKEETTE